MFQHKLKKYIFLFPFLFFTFGGTIYAQKVNKSVKN